MKIAEEVEYFILDYDADSNVHSFSIVPVATDVLRRWTAYTRISPAWRLLTAHPRRRKAEVCGYALMGPINPAMLEIKYGKHLAETFQTNLFWTTLGCLNLVIGLSTNDEFNEAAEFAGTAGVVYELWRVEDGDSKNEKLISLI